MSELVQAVVEEGMSGKYGKPACCRCANEKDCLIAFMGAATNIKPTYVAAPGCGRFEPKREEAERERCLSRA